MSTIKSKIERMVVTARKLCADGFRMYRTPYRRAAKMINPAAMPITMLVLTWNANV